MVRKNLETAGMEIREATDLPTRRPMLRENALLIANSGRQVKQPSKQEASDQQVAMEAAASGLVAVKLWPPCSGIAIDLYDMSWNINCGRHGRSTWLRSAPFPVGLRLTLRSALLVGRLVRRTI